MKELWVEKYRPKTVDGYVFRDDHQRKQIATWIKDKSIPHLLLPSCVPKALMRRLFRCF